MKAMSFSSSGKAGIIQNKEVIFSFTSKGNFLFLSPSGQNSLESKVFYGKKKISKFTTAFPPII